MKNYYRILNIPNNASYELIKKKYIKKAKKYHPDRNNNYNANKYFKLVTEAYHVLSDPYKRGKYDAKLEMNYINLSDLSNTFNDRMSLFDNIDINNSGLFDMDNNNVSKNVKSYSFTSSSSSKKGKIITKKKYKTNIN